MLCSNYPGVEVGIQPLPEFVGFIPQLLKHVQKISQAIERMSDKNRNQQDYDAVHCKCVNVQITDFWGWADIFRIRELPAYKLTEYDLCNRCEYKTRDCSIINMRTTILKIEVNKIIYNKKDRKHPCQRVHQH